MMREPRRRPTKPFFKRRGGPLLITGIILMVFFGLYIMADHEPGDSLATPIWLGVALGLGMAGYGLYRTLMGPGMLDNPRGGTNNEPQ